LDEKREERHKAQMEREKPINQTTLSSSSTSVPQTVLLRPLPSLKQFFFVHFRPSNSSSSSTSVPQTVPQVPQAPQVPQSVPQTPQILPNPQTALAVVGGAIEGRPAVSFLKRPDDGGEAVQPVEFMLRGVSSKETVYGAP
jgi:hypothetical protein